MCIVGHLRLGHLNQSEFILLFCSEYTIAYIACKCYICLPISAYGYTLVLGEAEQNTYYNVLKIVYFFIIKVSKNKNKLSWSK